MCDHGRCLNMEGSFRCVCDPGYRLGPDGKHCMDIDECINNPCQHGNCLNSPGSFRCECHPGFNIGPDGRTCLETRRDLCYQQYKDGQCFNPSLTAVTKSTCCCCTVVTGQPMGWGTNCQPCPMPGTTDFDLLCPHGPGSTFDGNDINECALNPSICQNGACENIIGGYRCICNPGFESDENMKICTDINECEDQLVSGSHAARAPDPSPLQASIMNCQIYRTGLQWRSVSQHARQLPVHLPDGHPAEPLEPGVRGRRRMQGARS